MPSINELCDSVTFNLPRTRTVLCSWLLHKALEISAKFYSFCQFFYMKNLTERIEISKALDSNQEQNTVRVDDEH